MSKLNQHQIKQMKAMKDNGVSLSFIAKVFKFGEGVSRSAIYYHLSDNRKAYEYEARKARDRQKEFIAKRLDQMVERGMSTGEIARKWDVPLKTVNRIYTA